MTADPPAAMATVVRIKVHKKTVAAIVVSAAKPGGIGEAIAAASKAKAAATTAAGAAKRCRTPHHGRDCAHRHPARMAATTPCKISAGTTAAPTIQTSTRANAIVNAMARL